MTRLIEKGDYKQAIAKAKALHKQSGSPETETLLAEAYCARILSFPPGAGAEAKTLMDMVSRRLPGERARLEEIRPLVVARHGFFEELLVPLDDPAAPPETRRRIEEAIRLEVTDLRALAECSALPTRHSLKVAARAASRAFDAVTSGNLEDEDHALAEISRRSPLSDWKLLIKAIAHFYRREDERCEKLLRSIDSSSAPARLVPSLHALVSGAGPSSSQGDELVGRVSGSEGAFRRALAELDRAFAQNKERKIIAAVRHAVRACERERPELTEQLKQRVAVRCFTAELPARRVKAAMGSSSLHDAAFWRLMAQAMEAEGDAVKAVGFWAEFRRGAIHEGWFAKGEAEESVVYLRMASIIASIDGDLLGALRDDFARNFPGFGEDNRDQPQHVMAAAPPSGAPDLYFLDPSELFKRASRCYPHRETFGRWLAWAGQQRDWRLAEEAALAWKTALSEDSEPLLHLMEASEKRNALKKALAYLEEAERRDRLNPKVKKARLRLLVATALRHLRNRKLRLADKDVERLAALDEMRFGDRDAMLASLRWLRCSLQGSVEASRHRGEVVRRLDESTACVLLQGLATACKLEARQLDLPKAPALFEVGHLVVAVARAVTLGDDLGVTIGIPDGWEKRLARDLPSGAAAISPMELQVLAEAALRRGNRKLAYAASGLGLQHPESYTARFLLLRARSLPDWELDRIDQCLEAAAALARRERNLELVKEAVEAGRRGRAPWENPLDVEPMSPEEVGDVISIERRSKGYPAYRPRSRYARNLLCDCPACRANRGDDSGVDSFDPFIVDASELDEEGGYGPFDDMTLPPELEDLTPDVLSPILELIDKYADEDGELPDLGVMMKRDPELVARLDRALRKHSSAGGRRARRSGAGGGRRKKKPRKKRTKG